MTKRVVIKIGSNVLTRDDRRLDVTKMSSLVDQVSALHQAGVQVILVSSGAVASGRNEVKVDRVLDAVSARQLYSAVGQAKLINRYYELFRDQGICCGQILTTKESLGTRSHYLTQKHCMEVMLTNHVIPIVNENDTISVTELMFTDNDELSGLIATMMNADTLLILSNIDGIFNGDPKDPSSKVIEKVECNHEDLEQYIRSEKSSFGRGGMLTKCNMSLKVAEQGIEVIIANGKKDGIIPDVLLGRKPVCCTRFVPNPHAASNIKKWIAHSEDFAKGAVCINRGAEEAIASPKAVSVLFVGVTRVEGEFEKDDLVYILNEDNHRLGLGRANFSYKDAQALVGKKDQKPMIHYDYLWLNQE